MMINEQPSSSHQPPVVTLDAYDSGGDDEDNQSTPSSFGTFASSSFHHHDEDVGFFEVGRDFEPSNVTHKFSAAEKRHMATFESVDYIEPLNQPFKAYVETAAASQQMQKWICFAVIGVCVGLTAFVLKQTIETLISSRVDKIEKLMEEKHAAGAYFFMLFHSSLLVLVAALVVVFIAPSAGGSGIPGVIGYLNGVHIKKVFNVRTVIVKFISCIFAVGSGLPVGPEGPMISLGAAIGAGISQGRSKTLGFTLDIFRDLRNSRDKRDSITCGAACGVSSAFAAPLGGLLFALEEVSSYWGPRLTWMIFFGSMSAAFTINLFASAFDKWKYSGQFGFFEDNSTILFQQETVVRFNVVAVPAVILIGAIGGALGAVFTFINLKVTRWRSIYIRPARYRQLLEPILIVIAFSTLMFIVPYMFECRNKSELKGEELEALRFNCKGEDQFHPMATLTIGSGDNAIRHMFTRGLPHLFSYGEILLLLLLYFVFACYTAGTFVSSGLVVPMLFIGSLTGRAVGLVLVDIFGAQHAWLDPGVFALIGAGSFFGGVSRLTVSLTVIMLEISDEIHLLLPIMLSVMVAKWTADFATHSLYHALLEIKCVPFLDTDTVVPKLECFTASTVMSKTITCMREHVKVSELRKLLRRTKHNAFPIVETAQHARLSMRGGSTAGDDDVYSSGAGDDDRGGGGECVFTQTPENLRSDMIFRGIILRSQLHMLLHMDEYHVPSQSTLGRVIPYETQRDYWDSKFSKASRRDTLAMLGSDNDDGNDDGYIDLRPYVNTSAITVNADFALSLAYTLFRSMGLRHLTVVNALNNPVGMITRKDLLGQTIEERIANHHRERMMM